MIVLVTGGRNYWEWDTVCMVLDMIGPSRVVHGAATGADTEADYWARTRGMLKTAYPIRRPREDGFQRNQRMLDSEPEIGLVVAFPGQVGTADMVRRARAANIRVIEVKGTWPGNSNLFRTLK